MTRHIVNIRHYTNEGKLIGVNKTPVANNHMAATLARSILAMDATFRIDSDPFAALMPTNISVRGPKGRFVKWKK